MQPWRFRRRRLCCRLQLLLFFVLFMSIFLQIIFWGRCERGSVEDIYSFGGAGVLPQPDGDPSPKLPRDIFYEVNDTLWNFTGSIDSLVEKVVSRDKWGPAMVRSHENTLDEWTVSNVSCKRLASLNVTADEMTRRYVRHRKVKDVTGCDMLSVPFNPRHDDPCIRFMTNPLNWEEVVPIDQLRDQRTLKFAIVFKPLRLASGELIERPLETLVKVPQRSFVSEAAGESAAFHADRILLIHRVPPTGWACLPLHMIEECVERYKGRVTTDELFLRMAGVSSYEDWVQKDLFEFSRVNGHLKSDSNGEECIGVSIQLKIADVGHFLKSPMRIPYESHLDKWHAYFNFNDNSSGLAMMKFLHENGALGIFHLAELNMFDYVIGNMDRSPNKNNFVVGGVSTSKTNDSTFMLHPNQPSFIYLDHGMTFFRRYPPRNPITVSQAAFKKGKPDTFCLFRAVLLRRIHDMMQLTGSGRNEALFALKMKSVLPSEVYSVIGSDGLHYCFLRGRNLLAMAERCLANERIRSHVLFP